jgi:hypothetical protein
MANENRDAVSPAPAHKHRSFPVDKVGAAIDPSDLTRVLEALEAAGFPRDQINVMTAADVPDLDQPIGGSGLRGLLRRLNLDLGYELQELEDAREELKRGHTLILVPAGSDAEQEQAHAILRQHCGHHLRYFGRWTVRELEDNLP